MSVLCAMVGASFVTAVAEVIRSKKGITAVGNAQVDTAQSKFGGASALFDGTGDYLLIDSTNSSSLNFGTNDFTLEFFSRATVRDQFHTIIANNKSSWTAGSVTLLGGSGSTSTTALRLAANSFNSGGAGIVFDNQAMTTGVWYHYAIVRSGNNFTMFRDGTSVSTGTFSGAINLGEDGTRIGYTRWDGDVSTWDGHIDEIRISNNARYTTTFTPTTTPFTNDANTLLLIHADGTDAITYFEDDNGVRSQIGISAHGTAALSSTQSKFGGASLDFGDGVSDYYKVYAPTASYFGGTGDMTFEFQYYRKSTGSGGHITDFRTGGSDAAWTIVDFDDGATTRLGLYQNGYIVASNIAVSRTTWTHIALVRQGATVKWYKNGTLTDTSTVTSSAWGNRTDCFIGANWAGQDAANNASCYIDELRISSIARYTANFTAPAAAFTNDANTLLLIHADGTNGSTIVTDDNA